MSIEIMHLWYISTKRESLSIVAENIEVALTYAYNKLGDTKYIKSIESKMEVYVDPKLVGKVGDLWQVNDLTIISTTFKSAQNCHEEHIGGDITLIQHQGAVSLL